MARIFELYKSLEFSSIRWQANSIKNVQAKQDMASAEDAR
jgi:hypothetical protein